jgi:hypothetical protein
VTRQPPEQDLRRKLVRVAATEDRREAEAWFESLKQAGIPARVAVRENGTPGGPQRLLLYVLEEDRERALAALSASAPAMPAFEPVPDEPPRAVEAVEVAPAAEEPAEGPSAAGDPGEPPPFSSTDGTEAPAGITFAAVSGWLGLAFLVASVILIVLSMR